MVFVETSFPRGGVTKPIKTSIETPNIEFGASTLKRKKEKLNKKQRFEKRKHENENKRIEQIEAVSAEGLSTKTVSEGMIVMGCVTKIETTYLQISLPGRLIGQVNVKNISKSYVNIVNQMVNDADNVDGYKTLEEMFTIGQIVCVRVMEVKQQTRFGISLSMIPADVQADFRHKRIAKGMILAVAVEGIEDHGFVIETGIKNLRGFLPVANTDANLGVGEIVFCQVTEMKSANAASTAILTSIDVGSRKLKHIKEPNLTHILPTTIVKFKIKKVLDDGLQGTLMNDTFTGYINEHQLETALSSPNDYKEGDEVEARVLYTMPITKLVYLTLKLDHSITLYGDELKIGAIVNKAKVTRVGTGGLILKLNNCAKGLISFKSLRIGVQTNFDKDEVMAKYHKNSEHQIRIIAYDPMDSLYICSVDERIIAEKFFSVEDVEVGDYVEAKIIRPLKDGGFEIKVGSIPGYIEKMQISTAIAAAKLEPNTKLRCRVLRKSVKNNKIFLTNRKELMSSEAMLLKSYEKAVVGLEYHGMIVKIYPDGFLISFCQYVKGMLFKKNLTEMDLANTTNFYHEGQISKFRVMNVSGENITLGIGDFISQTGTILEGKVSIVAPNSLQVAFANNKLSGIVPSMFLTNFPSLVPILINTYKANEAVKAVSINQDIYSLRDVDGTQQLPVKHWNDLKVGDVVGSFVKNVNGEVIDLMCFIEGYDKIVKVHAKMLLQNYDRQTKIELVPEQTLHVRVLGRNKTLKSLTCSAKLSDVWQGNLSETASIYRQYFKDLQRIQIFCQKNNNPIGNLNIGDVVQATVKNEATEDTQGFVYAKLSHNVQGVLSPSNIGGIPKIGDKIDCLIIWIDYVKNCVHLTMKRKFLERRKNANYATVPKSSLYTSKGVKADILKIVDDFIVLYPRALTNKLVFVPTKFHYNDLQPVILDGIKEGDMCNVTMIDSDGEYIIGMFESIRSKLKQFQPLRGKNQSKFAKSPTETYKDDEGIDDDNENDAESDADDKDDNEDDKDDSDDDDENNDEDDDDSVNTEGIIENSNSETEEPEVIAIKKVRKEKRKVDSKERVEEETVPKKIRKSIPKFQIEQLDGSCDPISNSDDEEILLSPPRNYVLLPKKQAKINRAKVIQSTQPPSNYVSLPKKQFTKKIRPTAKQAKQPAAVLPGVNNFWTTDLATSTKSSHPHPDSSSSEDETEKPDENPMKKRKLTPDERFQMARDEEARIRQIEESYANNIIEPTTVDQFERLVLAQPDDSRNWIKYMVFHMQANEVEKARVVARKALNKISFREDGELLNIWVALLNLELRYGEKDTFDKLLSEAIMLNEPFKVYEKCMQIYADCRKIPELCDMVSTVTKKFRANPDAWTLSAMVFFEVGLEEKAKQLLTRSLKSLPDRDHVNTIVKFANLSNKYKQSDYAHALLEQVLTSYPKRVDIWSIYVDMLVKGNQVDLARQTLERAVAQKIPIKKMRTMFKKFLDFEEKFGSPENLQKVKAMATSYVEKEIEASK